MDRQSGADLIAAERQRQIEVEGWTPEHDDDHDCGELNYAACAYLDWADAQAKELLDDADWREGVLRNDEPVPHVWPWDASWFRPSDDLIRNLVKAGALIAAEIDRLQRAAKGIRQHESVAGRVPRRQAAASATSGEDE